MENKARRILDLIFIAAVLATFVVVISALGCSPMQPKPKSWDYPPKQEDTMIRTVHFIIPWQERAAHGDFSEAKIGKQPDHRKQTELWIRQNLADPKSTTVRSVDTQPVKAYYLDTPGWAWRAYLIGPNAFGALIEVRFWFFSIPGKIVAIQHSKDLGFYPIRRRDP